MTHMKTKIVEQAARGEQAIIDDIAGESERLGAAQQEAAKLEDRRAAMLATESLDKIHALGDSLARARLRIEVAESRLDGLNGQLRRLYAREAQAAIDAELAPLSVLDAEEQGALPDYETHARLVAEALARLGAIADRRHQVSVRVHQLNGQWIPVRSPTHRASLAQVKLPSATGDKDFWPPQSAAMLEVQERAARDAAALEEYHRGGR
jgi:hypothetical protein